MKESTGKKQKRKQAPNKKSKNLVISFVFFFLRFSFQARKAGSLSKSPPMLHRGGDHRLPKRIGRVQSDHLRTGGPMRWMTRWWQLKHQQPLERAMFSQIPKRSRLESPEKTVEKIRGYVNFTGVYWLIDLIHVLNKKTHLFQSASAKITSQHLSVARLSKRRRWRNFFVFLSWLFVGEVYRVAPEVSFERPKQLNKISPKNSSNDMIRVVFFGLEDWDMSTIGRQL